MSKQGKMLHPLLEQSLVFDVHRGYIGPKENGLGGRGKSDGQIILGSLIYWWVESDHISASQRRSSPSALLSLLVCWRQDAPQAWYHTNHWANSWPHFVNWLCLATNTLPPPIRRFDTLSQEACSLPAFKEFLWASSVITVLHSETNFHSLFCLWRREHHAS